jgi:hypothetical protein
VPHTIGDTDKSASVRTLILMAGVILLVVAGFRQVSGLYMIPVTECLGTGLEPFSRSMALVSLIWASAVSSPAQ